MSNSINSSATHIIDIMEQLKASMIKLSYTQS